MVKRGAAATSGAATKRVKAPAQDVDPLMEKCTLVYNAIEAAAQLPEGASAMLKSVLPLCLGVCQAERHEYMQSVAKIAADELAKVKAMYQEVVSREEATIGSLDEEKQQLEAARAEMSADWEGKAAALQARKSELARDARAFQAARRAHEDAQARQASGEAGAAAAGRRRADLESASRDLLQPLKEGTTADENGAPELARLLCERLGGLIDLSDTLAATIPSVLGKATADRGPFDTIAIQQLEEAIEKQLAFLATVIRDGDSMQAACAEETRLAVAAFEAAQERQNASAAAFTAAQKDNDDVELLIKEASEKMRLIPSRKGTATRKLQAAQGKLDAFCGGPLSTFTELCYRDQHAAEDSGAAPPAEEAPCPDAQEPEVPAQDAPCPPGAEEAAVVPAQA